METEIFHIGGPCFVLKLDNALTIACDPALNPAGTQYSFKTFKSARIEAPIYSDSLFKDIDLWLITHKHADHLDQPGIKSIGPNSTVIAQRSALKLLNTHPSKIALEWHQVHEFNKKGLSVSVKAIPAFHAGNAIARALTGRVNGYLVKVARGSETRTVYITSDTIYHPRLASVLKNEKIDILLANLGEVRKNSFGGPLTMTVPMLRRMANEVAPLKVIPLHYNDFAHYETDLQELETEGFSVIPKGAWVSI